MADPRSYESAPPPPAPASTDSQQFIGVRDDFQASVMDQGPTGPLRLGSIPPRYRSGDQTIEPSALSPETRAELQVRLRNLGLIPSSARIVLGVWDGTSAEAMKQVMAVANSTGTTWASAMQDMERNGQQFGEMGGESKAAKLPTNTQDIRALANATAEKLLGRRLRPDQLDAFVSAYHTKENPYLDPNAPPTDSSGKPITEASKDPNVFAEQQVETLDPEGVVANNSLGTMKDFFSLLKDPFPTPVGGGVPG